MTNQRGFILLVRTPDGAIHEYPCRFWDRCENFPSAICALTTEGDVLYWFVEKTPEYRLAVAALQARLRGIA